MSALRFDVYALSAGAKSKVLVPADDALVSEAFSPKLVAAPLAAAAGGAQGSSSFSSPAVKKIGRAARSSQPTFGVVSLASSPLVAGKVFLRNQERFPVMFTVHVLRTSATRRKKLNPSIPVKHHPHDQHHSADGHDHDDDADSTQTEDAPVVTLDEDDANAALYVHPVRGIIKPGGVRVIAALLPPPPKSEPSDKQQGQNQQTRSQQHQRARSPSRRVTFASDATGDEEEDDSSPTQSQQQQQQQQQNSKVVLVRMQIEARVMLAELPEAVLESLEKREKELADAARAAADKKGGGDNDSIVADEDAATVLSDHADASVDNNNKMSSLLKNHRDELELLHLHTNSVQWAHRWTSGLELPTRTIEIVSTMPPVTREQWLHYLIKEKLLPRCDRLARRNTALINRHEKSLREIADFKAADRADKLTFLVRKSAVRVPLWMFIVAVVAFFLTGLAA